MKEVIVEHIWTKETKVLQVNSIIENKIYVYWPLAGTYVIDLKENTLRACSQKAQLRHKNIVPWKLKYLEETRADARIHLDGIDKKKETDRLSKIHHDTMPGRKVEKQ